MTCVNVGGCGGGGGVAAVSNGGAPCGQNKAADGVKEVDKFVLMSAKGALKEPEGVNLDKNTGVAKGAGALNAGHPSGAAYDGKPIPTNGSAYKIGNYTGVGYPDANNFGPRNPQYDGMYEKFYQRLVDKFGQKKVDTVIKIYEDAYQKNGINKNMPEFSHHDKSIHYLIEQLNDNLSLDPDKLQKSQAAQRDNYGVGGAQMADAAGAAALVLAGT